MKKIKILILLISSISSLEAFSCSKKVDEKKVVLFIDNNYSIMEIDKAKEAACARGEKLVVLPNGYDQSKNVGKHYVKGMYYSERENYCRSKGHSNCDQYREKSDEAFKSYYDKKNSEGYNLKMSKSILDKTLKEYAEDGIAVTSLVVSGHDGGGNVYGDSGNINKNQIINSFTESYKDKPELKEELKSVLMWGCYTATQSEVTAWKYGLPHLNVLAGFHGSGPRNTKVASGTFMKDVLIKEKNLHLQCNEKQLKKMINGIDDINYTLHGMYVKTRCGGEYYRNQEAKYNNDGQTKYSKNFIDLNESPDCEGITKLFTEKRNLYRNYISGWTEPSLQTSGTNLREMYSFIRQNNHLQDTCPTLTGTDDLFMNGDHIGLLLFWHGVKENFAKVFNDEIKEAEAENQELFTKLDKYFNNETLKIDLEIDDINKKKNILLEKHQKEAFSKLTEEEQEVILEAVYDKLKIKRQFWFNKRGKKVFKRLPEHENEKLLFEMAIRKGFVKKETQEIKNLSKSVESLLTDKNDVLNYRRKIESSYSPVRNYKVPTLEYLKKANRQEILTNISKLDIITNPPAKFENDKNFLNITKNLSAINKKQEKYLNELNPDCMDFLDWHEAVDGHTPTPLCE